MTTKIRAHIWRTSARNSPLPWVILAEARDATSGKLLHPDAAIYSRTASHPEALEAAYTLMAELDRELMAEVHESRASRRAERVATIADEAAAAAIWPQPPIIPMTPVTHLFATMEATR